MPSSPLRIAATLAALALLTGFSACRSERADRADRYADALVGLDQADLRACAGRPARTRSSGTEWIFVAGDPLSVERAQRYGGSPRFCEATVRLIDGAVASVRYGGPSGALSGRNAECAAIFSRC